MPVTNLRNLPTALVRAIENDPYNKGDADFSVTELLKPARQWALEKKYADQVTEDASDRLWSLYGQIAHSIIERANVNELVEERFFTEIAGYVVSGQIDSLCLESGTLRDFKFTTSWAFMANREPKEEWIAQLNMQKLLVEANTKHKVKSLEIVGLLRDWQIRDADKNKNYPQVSVAVMPIPIWETAQTHLFVIQKMEEKLAALESLPQCSSQETWGRKRCASYCKVSDYCTQYQDTKGTK